MTYLEGLPFRRAIKNETILSKLFIRINDLQTVTLQKRRTVT